MFEGAFDPKWKEYGADEWSDALVAAMKLGGVEHLFFVSGSEIGFYQESVAKAQERGWPTPQLITVPHEGVALNAALGETMISGQPAASGELPRFAEWCKRAFCGAEPKTVHGPAHAKPGTFLGGVVLPHTLPMFEARHKPNDHRHKSLAAIEEVRRRLEDWKPDVMVLVSTHWMPREGFFIDDGAMHQDGCDASYKGVEAQLSFPGDSELAALAAYLGKEAGLPVRRLHRVAQEHAVWVPSHLLSGERSIPVVPCSIWWHGPREAHRRLGEVFAEAVRRLGRKAFFIASGGLSHTFDFSKPPEYVVPAGERMDRLAVEWLEKGQHGRLLDMSDEEFETWNPEGRAGHLYMLWGALGRDVPGQSLCYQGSNGTGYLTMLFQN